MLVDGVGSSLIANAPYADKGVSSAEFKDLNSKSVSKMQHQVPANARAGSMKTQFQNNNGGKLHTDMAAYEDDKHNVNIQNYKNKESLLTDSFD